MSFVRHDNAIVWKAQKQCISWLQNAGKLPARFVRFLVSVDSSWRFPRLSYNTVVSVFTIKWVIDRDGRELVLFLVKRGIINSEFSKGVFFVFVQHISRKGSPLMKNTSNVKVFQEVDNVRWSVNPILSWKCLFSPRTSEKNTSGPSVFMSLWFIVFWNGIFVSSPAVSILLSTISGENIVSLVCWRRKKQQQFLTTWPNQSH